MVHPLQRTLEWFESPEGQKALDEYIEAQKEKESITNYHLDKLDCLSKDEFLAFFQKCYDKYSSRQYSDREFKLGREPHTSLYFLIYDYLERNKLSWVKKLTTGNHISMFNDIAYCIDNKWIIRVLNGQGTVCQVYAI